MITLIQSGAVLGKKKSVRRDSAGVSFSRSLGTRVIPDYFLITASKLDCRPGGAVWNTTRHLELFLLTRVLRFGLWFSERIRVLAKGVRWTTESNKIFIPTLIRKFNCGEARETSPHRKKKSWLTRVRSKSQEVRIGHESVLARLGAIFSCPTAWCCCSVLHRQRPSFSSYFASSRRNWRHALLVLLVAVVALVPGQFGGRGGVVGVVTPSKPGE